MEPLMLTVPQVAEVTATGKTVVREWIHRKEDPLPANKLPGMTKNYRIFRKELEEWLDRNAVRVN